MFAPVIDVYCFPKVSTLLVTNKCAPAFAMKEDFVSTRKGNAKKAHISRVSSIKDDADKAAIISWVDSQANVQFVAGEGPTPAG